MEYGKAIYSILSGDNNVTNEVGNRIFPVRAAQGASYPYIVYRFISDTPSNFKQGKADFDQASLQVSVYSKEYPKVCSISESIRDALERKSGTFNGVDVSDISFDDLQDLFDEDQKIHMISNDFTIFINR